MWIFGWNVLLPWNVTEKQRTLVQNCQILSGISTARFACESRLILASLSAVVWTVTRGKKIIPAIGWTERKDRQDSVWRIRRVFSIDLAGAFVVSATIATPTRSHSLDAFTLAREFSPTGVIGFRTKVPDDGPRGEQYYYLNSIFQSCPLYLRKLSVGLRSSSLGRLLMWN